LGDGFKVAMRDLDIRGAGNLLGAEQSGFINDLGFDMYHKILDEAIQELKQTEFQQLFMKELSQIDLKQIVPDCVIETDLSILIPESYVNNTSERLGLYSTLDNIKNEEELEGFVSSLRDRFGPIPQEVNDLIKTVRVRWFAQKLGFEKVTLKNDSMKGYFVPSANEAYYKSEVFGKILQWVQKHPKISRLKELNKKLMLIFDDVPSIETALELMQNMLPESLVVQNENN
jgi:transcription-repair coupling factor (superfamily II helicase)